jgi:Transglutaminase-like superfamily
MRGLSALPDAWHLRLRTLEAIIGLFGARFLIGQISLGRWRHRFGCGGKIDRDQAIEARRLAVHVVRAAGRTPFEAKCLPQALALSWMLRRRGIPHALVIAARPAALRPGPDNLHAWVEAGESVVLGELPGPWVEVLRIP